MTIIEKEVKKIIKKFGFEFSLEDIKKTIWEEETKEDHQRYIEMFTTKYLDIKTTNKILWIASMAWNNFPHKSLNGLSPMEIAEKFKKDKS